MYYLIIWKIGRMIETNLKSEIRNRFEIPYDLKFYKKHMQMLLMIYFLSDTRI